MNLKLKDRKMYIVQMLIIRNWLVYIKTKVDFKKRMLAEVKRYFNHDKRVSTSGWHNHIIYWIIIMYMITNMLINNVYIIIMMS